MTLSTNTIWEVSKLLVAAHLSVIPIDPNPTKKPAGRMLPIIGQWPDGNPRRGWAPLKQRLPTEEELEGWFNTWGFCGGIAVVCGEISDGLEAIDIDSFDTAIPWMERLQCNAPGLLDRLIQVRTPRPGLHIYYRCLQIGRNDKLAQAMVMNPSTNNLEIKTLIETRGEGGYALIPPTPGHCHPTGRRYEYVTRQSLAAVQRISVDERNLLFEISRSFDAIPQRQATPPAHVQFRRPADLRRPDDDFNARADWTELLQRYGWSFFHTDADGTEHWTRPGKAQGTSATLNYQNNGLLHIFSSNVEPLEEGRSYTKFHFIVLMEYEGNFKRANAALLNRGYGQPPLPAGRRHPPRRHSHRPTSPRRRNHRKR